MIPTDEMEIVVRINTDEISVDTFNRKTGECLSSAKGMDLSFLVSLFGGQTANYLLDLIKSMGYEEEILGQ